MHLVKWIEQMRFACHDVAAAGPCGALSHRSVLGRRSQQTSPALLGIHSLRDTDPNYNTLKAQSVTKGGLVDIVAE